MRYLDSFHPAVIFAYFVGIIFVCMLTLNPIIITISGVSGILFYGSIVGWKKLGRSLLFSVPLFLLIAITNPLFVHEGETVLFDIFSIPITLEALIYGCVVGGMLLSVMYWFMCYGQIMTNDKFVFLFGRILPKLSLIISMTFRFIPRYKMQYKRIEMAQKALGVYSSASWIGRIKSKLRVMSALITWALENSIETADSMRARGYGLKGRSCYSIFRWTVRDSIFIIIISILTIFCVTCIFVNISDFTYYPKVSAINISNIAISMYVGVFLLAFLSFISQIGANSKWQTLKLKI